jgi:hypothetical protein
VSQDNDKESKGLIMWFCNVVVLCIVYMPPEQKCIVQDDTWRSSHSAALIFLLHDEYSHLSCFFFTAKDLQTLIIVSCSLIYFLYFFRDMDDSASLDESVENLDRGSVASFGSGNTTDSDKVGRQHHSLNLVGAIEITQNQCWMWHDIWKISCYPHVYHVISTWNDQCRGKKKMVWDPLKRSQNGTLSCSSVCNTYAIVMFAYYFMWVWNLIRTLNGALGNKIL